MTLLTLRPVNSNVHSVHQSDGAHVGNVKQVGAVWKFTFGFLRERTPDGVWFTRGSDWHLEGREVFVHRTVDYHEERTDVRKVF